MATGWIILAQFVCVQLASGTKVNVARGKPVYVSSRLIGRDPTLAVDGDTMAVNLLRNKQGYGVMHTAHNQPDAWWWVDLQTEVQDPTVKIYFRTDYIRRRNGVQLYTSTTSFNTYPSGDLCYTVTGSPDGSDIPDVVSVNCPGTWRYLMVYTNTDNSGGDGAVLDFGEVEVLVCVIGTYGANCTKSCSSRHCSVTFPQCDRNTGVCPRGCEPGWMGTDCTQECPKGTFGLGCLSCSIRHCQGESDCSGDGTCSGGCQDGWTLDNCTQACPSGEYGPGCGLTCGNCIGDNICNNVTGNCPGDCKAGWQGSQCTQACPGWKYGVNCMETCVHCADSCDVVEGHCLGGCEEGYRGAQCDLRLISDTGVHSVSAVIGAVIGAVVMFVVIGAVLCCLLRYGRLQWMTTSRSKDFTLRTEITDVARPHDISHGVAERSLSGSSPTYNNDYAVLDTDTKSNNTDYDVIESKQ